MLRFSWAVILIWLGLLIFHSQPVMGREYIDFSGLEKVVRTELKQTHTPGAAIAIVKGEQIVFAKGFGVANIETGAPVTPDMLFRIGSITKMWTATLLVTLAEKGRVNLQEPIGTYLQGLSPRLSRVTAHQLMTHTAGMIDESPSYGLHDESALGATVRSWQDDYCFLPPGKVFSYSNPGMAVAGLLAEVTGGKPYAQLMSERLFQPMGIKTATFRPTEAMTRPLSQGHMAEKNKTLVVRPCTDNAGYWPSGFMFANVYDLARFAIAFINQGQIEGAQVLSPSVIAKLSTPYVDAPAMNCRVGYGLFIKEARGARVLVHRGGIEGFGSTFIMVPAYKFAVILLANNTEVMLNQTAAKAMELFLPPPPKEKEKKSSSVVMPLTAKEMSDWAGIYQNPFATLELLAKDDNLFFKQGDAELLASKAGDRRLSIHLPQGARQEIVLVAGPDGRVEFLCMNDHAFKRVDTNK
jgi:CubicO group peptidase (beta-lactamase class C family)